MSIRLFDGHCHLQDERLAPFLEDAMTRASEAGLLRFACCGTSESDWSAVERLLNSRPPTVIAGFGLHPWHIRERSAQWQEQLAAFLELTTDATVGEIGLDHALEQRYDEEQSKIFQLQLGMAKDMNRPVSVHCRRAWGALLDALRPFGALPCGVLIHSYSGDRHLVPLLLRHNAFFSFSGSITRSGNRRGQRALLEVPEDRLLIETDSPDLMPVVPADQMPYGERVNHPANLVHVLHAVAGICGLPEARLADILWRNSCRFFGAEEV